MRQADVQDAQAPGRPSVCQHTFQDTVVRADNVRWRTDATAPVGHSGSALLRQRAQQLQERAAQVREATVDYIQHEPMKAVLVAAAGGALLLWLGSLLGRRSTR